MYSFEELIHINNRKELIGMKAESLIYLLDNGFNVPDGFVITTSEIWNFSNEELLKYADENTEYAVRSSGTKEDLAGASFAGQYDTCLNVKGISALRDAIKKCAQSITNERVSSYAKRNNIDIKTCKMAVIVQQMINSEKSGVAFSIDSVNGLDKEIIIEAVAGLGEKLVSGHVTPDYYSYNWYDENFTTYNGGLLTQDEVRKLSETILDIQICYGFPVDVEWAITSGIIHILQSRPITTISYKSIPLEWTTANFRDGGVSSAVCKPITASLYGLVFNPSFLNSLKDIKVMTKNDNCSLYETFFARPYWCLSAEKESFAKLPGFVERKIDEDMGVAPTYEGDGIVTETSIKSVWNGIIVLSAVRKHIKNIERKAREYQADFLSRFEAIKHTDFPNKTADELHNLLLKFVNNDYYDSQYTYFSYIFCNMILSTLFKDKIKKHLPSDEVMNLMVGLDDLSHMRPIYEMWDMRQLDTAFLMDAQEFKDFIHKYKHRSHHEIDISYPNWDETPEIALNMIADFAKSGDSQSPKQLCAKQKQKYYDTLAKIPKKLHKDVERLRSFLWWREEFRDITSQSYYLIRKMTLLLAEAWKSNGVLDSADDIFFLTIDDIESKICLREKVAKNKNYYYSFANFKSPNEIGNRHIARRAQIDGTQILKGVPCGGETLTGSVRVIKDIHDTGRLKQGDILVTKCTDTAWTAVFSKLSGVITETGGILSHAAVISREYGIACILVVKNATDVLKDGDIITMDCKTGEIYKHD